MYANARMQRDGDNGEEAVEWKHRDAPKPRRERMPHRVDIECEMLRALKIQNAREMHNVDETMDAFPVRGCFRALFLSRFVRNCWRVKSLRDFLRFHKYTH